MKISGTWSSHKRTSLRHKLESGGRGLLVSALATFMAFVSLIKSQPAYAAGERVFQNPLSKNAQSGSAAAVIANSSQGFGAVFQAQYHPRFEDAALNEVQWIGDVRAIFIDNFGLLREDSNGNDRLDGYQTDKVIEFFYETDTEVTKLRRFDSSSDSKFVKSGSNEAPLSDFKPVWTVGENLAALTDVQATTQRAYAASAATGRYIFTWMDTGAAPDGKAQAGEVLPFSAGSVTATNFGYFGVPSQATAQNIVNYVRGDSTIAGYRNRTADFDGDGATEVWRMADVVHSPPLAVGPPADNFDVVQGDPSYTDFKNRYKDRRVVVIAGSNGGLVHAFNGGFFDEATREYKTTDGSATAHPLGSELWAYAPMNLLPHLQWLPDPDYPHVYYVDGRPQVFDAKIFANDGPNGTHPGGWGTIAVIGMRLGGGDFEVDHDQDASTATLFTRSAYIVLDISDPERPPQLLAEVVHPNLGFTTGNPDVIFRFDADINRNTWYLAFGSGPTEPDTFTSTQNAHLFNYNLRGRKHRNGWPKDLAIANAFVGDVTGADFDLFQAGDDFLADPKYRTDAWYFGVTTGSGANPSGKLYRWLRIGGNLANSFKLLLDPGDGTLPAAVQTPDQAFVNAPVLSRDENGRIWVYAGSGRYYVKDDKHSDQLQTFYGLLEPVDADGDLTYGVVSKSDMMDVTDIEVFTDEQDGVEDGNGDIQNSDGSPVEDPFVAGEQIDTFTELETVIEEHSGWYRDMPVAGNGLPSTRNLSRASLIGGALLYTDFTPSEELREPLGESALTVVYFKTGTAHPGVILPDSVDLGMTAARIELGPGKAMESIIHQGTGSDQVKTTAIANKTTLELLRTDVDLPTPPGERTSWIEILMNN